MTVPDDIKVGMRALSRSLSAMDAKCSFDRCSVGREGCNQSSIKAHCIPRAALNLIANDEKKVVGIDAEPPRTPGHWSGVEPLGERSISNFSVGKWACAEHDRLFSSVDSKHIDVQDDRNLFLMVYRTTIYLTYQALRTASRLAIPMLDPFVDTPEGFPESNQRNLVKMAQDMSFMAMKTFYMKLSLDKLLNRKAHDEIEYRAAMWETVPTMAATGMKWVEGPGNGIEWYGENSMLPVWIILLPQDHGQTIITASPRGMEAYSGSIHSGMRKGGGSIVKIGNNWTDLMCKKALVYATDLAISHERLFQTSYDERAILQTYMFGRSFPDALKQKLPNLLNIR